MREDTIFRAADVIVGIVDNALELAGVPKEEFPSEPEALRIAVNFIDREKLKEWAKSYAEWLKQKPLFSQE